MDNFILNVFVDEIITQCEFAQMAMTDLQLALRRTLSLRRGFTRRVFFSAHAFLAAVANISKIFWPPSDKQDKKTDARAKTRGKELRKVLLVTSKSPIKDRRFRNHFEHYDARLDEWAASSKDKIYVDMNIGVRAITGPEPIDYMRNLDPKTLMLTFRGETYDLLATNDAVKALLNKAKAFKARSSSQY